MAYSIPREQVISYAPDATRAFELYGYEWIDDLWFGRSLAECLGDRSLEYAAVARERFLEAGW